MPRKLYGGRSLLNLPGHHSTAAIIAEVEDTRGWAGITRDSDDPQEATGYNIQPRITCTLSDCSGQINLEFDLGTDARIENSLHKVDSIIHHLRAFRRGLVAEDKRLRDRRERLPKSREHGVFNDDL